MKLFTRVSKLYFKSFMNIFIEIVNQTKVEFSKSYNRKIVLFFYSGGLNKINNDIFYKMLIDSKC